VLYLFNPPIKWLVERHAAPEEGEGILLVEI